MRSIMSTLQESAFLVSPALPMDMGTVCLCTRPRRMHPWLQKTPLTTMQLREQEMFSQLARCMPLKPDKQSQKQQHFWVCRTTQEPACSWESSNKFPVLEVTAEAESTYFNSNSNYSQISTVSKAPGKFNSLQSVLAIHLPRSITKLVVDIKSKDCAVLSSFIKVSCVPMQYS